MLALATLVALAVGVWTLVSVPPPRVTPTRAASTVVPASDARAAVAGHDAERLQPPAGSPAAHDRAATVHIVDEHFRPVPGASVVWLVTSEGWRWLEQPLQHREREVRAAGTTAVADDRGRVAIADGECAVVVARHGARYGQAVLFLGDDDERVMIAPERTLQVVVVDGAGRPQPGVPVRVAHRPDADSHYEEWGSGTWVGTTGADGTLRVDALGTLAHWPPARPRVALRAAVLGAEPEVVEVDLTAPPDVVRVPCPPFGFAVVQALAADGAAMPAFPRDVAIVSRGRLAANGNEHREQTGPDTARFGPLALGQRWELRAPFDARFAGPTTAGEVVAVTARLAARHGTARALRLLDPQGRVLADERIRLHRGRRADARWTDANGWLVADTGWTVHFPTGSAAWTGDAVHGETVALRPLVRTCGRVVDADTGAPLRAWFDVEPRAHDFAVFAEASLRDGTVLVLSDRAGVLHVRCGSGGYEPATASLTAGSAPVIALRADGLGSLRVRVRVEPDLPVQRLAVRLAADDRAPASQRRVEPGLLEVRWDGLRNELHRVEFALAPDMPAARAIDGLRPTREPRVAAAVDLRGLAAVATFTGPMGALWFTDGTSWGEARANEAMLLPATAVWYGFLEGDGLPVRFAIRAGVNATEHVACPTLRLACPGANVAFDAEDVTIRAYLWQRREPLLDAVEAAKAAGADEPAPKRDAAPTAAQLADLEPLGPGEDVAALSGVALRCPARGLYLVVPFLHDEPLLEQSTALEIDGTVPEVVASIAIDPAGLLAARREHTARSARGAGGR